MSKLIKNTILYSIGEVCPKIISFILLPIYTLFLSTSDYGIISYTNSVMLFLFILASLSLNSYVLRYYFIRETKYERKCLLGNIFLSIFFVNILILSLSYLLLPNLLLTFNVQIPWNPYFKLALLVNFLDSFSIIPLVFFRVEQNALKFISFTLSKTLVQVLLTLYFIVYKEVGLIGYFYAGLGTQLPFALIGIIVMLKNAVLRINISEIKEGLKYALPLLPGAISYFVLSLSDRIILERNVDIALIGIYNVAATIALSLNIIIQSGYKAIEPEIFKRYNTEGFVFFVKNTQKYFFSLIYMLGLTISLFSQEVFYFMTSESFYQGYRIVPILVIGVVMTGQNVIYSGVLSAACLTKSIGIATMIGAIFSLIFNIFFIPYWGIYAAAISSAFSFFIMNSFLYYKLPIKNKSTIKENICVVLMFLLSMMYLHVFNVEVSLVSIIIKVLIVFVYSVFVIKLLNTYNSLKYFSVKFSLGLFKQKRSTSKSK